MGLDSSSTLVRRSIVTSNLIDLLFSGSVRRFLISLVILFGSKSRSLHRHGIVGGWSVASLATSSPCIRFRSDILRLWILWSHRGLVIVISVVYFKLGQVELGFNSLLSDLGGRLDNIFL